METNNTNKPSQITAVIILSTGSHHRITNETYEQVCMAGLDDLITIGGSTFKTSAVMEIIGIEEYEKQYPDKVSYNVGQPYAALPAGNVYDRATGDTKELFLKGYRRVKPNATKEEVENFLKNKKNNTVRFDHIKNEKGEIIKPAWEVAKEAELLPTIN